MRPDLGRNSDATAQSLDQDQEQQQGAEQPPLPSDELTEAMGGASDGSSGGGAGAGIPGGGTDMRTAGRFDQGDLEEDRKKIFPEAKPKHEEQERRR
jgi:hypothetical protein